MTWIDNDLASREKIQARSQIITAHAEKVYNSLWDQVSEFAQEANTKGVKVYTNGTPFKRVVGLGPFRPHNPNSNLELIIELRKEPASIAVSGSHGMYSFIIDVCKDNVVCLKLSGKTVTIYDAAVHILRSFLFPDVVSKEYSESATA